MICDSVISWETLLRKALRLVEENSCASVAVDTTVNGSGSMDCQAPPLLTKFAMAYSDSSLFVQVSTGGEHVVPSCNSIAEIPTETLLGLTMQPGTQDDTFIFLVHDPGTLDALTCDRDCDEEQLSTEEMIRRSFIRPSDSYWALQVVFASGDALACSDVELSTEALIRASLVAVGDGTYAWRIVQEA